MTRHSRKQARSRILFAALAAMTILCLGSSLFQPVDARPLLDVQVQVQAGSAPNNQTHPGAHHNQTHPGSPPKANPDNSTGKAPKSNPSNSTGSPLDGSLNNSTGSPLDGNLNNSTGAAPGNSTIGGPNKTNGTSADLWSYDKFGSWTLFLGNNFGFINLAIETIHASQRAAWEQGVTGQAILEWQYPDWTTWDAPGGARSFISRGRGRGGRSGFPKDIILQALRSIVAQDVNGRLAAKVTGDEDPNVGSSLDSVSNVEQVLVAAFASGEIPNGQLSTGGDYAPAVQKAYTFATTKVLRGAGGIISQRVSELQYWADMMYMGAPSLAAFGLYTQNADALQLAYTQHKLELGVLLYPPGSGAKTGLLGHIRNEDGSWADPNVWVTGQGWGTLGMLRTMAALAQSSPAPLPNNTASNVADLLHWTADLLTAVHATFDTSASLWNNYVDMPSTFHDISGSLALAAATYRLATYAPSLVTPTQLRNAEAVYKRVTPHLKSNGQFGDGLQCVDALSFSTPGYTSVEALSFGILLEAARRDFTQARRGQTTPLIRTIRTIQL